jgi:hypothetical protein
MLFLHAALFFQEALHAHPLSMGFGCVRPRLFRDRPSAANDSVQILYLPIAGFLFSGAEPSVPHRESRRESSSHADFISVLRRKQTPQSTFLTEPALRHSFRCHASISPDTDKAPGKSPGASLKRSQRKEKKSLFFGPAAGPLFRFLN